MLLESFRTNLVKLRGKMSPRKVAALSGLQPSQVYRLEKGEIKAGPSLAVVEAIAGGLGVDPVTLITGKGSSELLIEMARREGFKGTIEDLKLVFRIAASSGLTGDTLTSLETIAREDPLSIHIFLSIMQHPATGKVALESAARACRIMP